MCRHCGAELKYEFIDLVNAPPSNSFLSYMQLSEPEVFYPLKIFVCDNCFLVQIDEYKRSNEIFNCSYPYFSSFSKSGLAHARNYVEMISEKMSLGENTLVIEIASNDGYLLQDFKAKGIPCLGIEPAVNIAKAAKEKGIDVIEDFFGTSLAGTLPKADLLVGNNILAHVPDINDFVKAMKTVLKPGGTITMEFPHLLNLIEKGQFDTIYHEHFSYLSLYTVMRIFRSFMLEIYDVEEIPTHGGSLRIYAKHAEDSGRHTTRNITVVLEKERDAGLHELKGYGGVQSRADKIKYDLLEFLLKTKKEGKSVAGYGAAAKGNTLLNYCGIKKDMIAFVADASPHKQGLFLPASHIPVVAPEAISEAKPDYVLILPWNIKDEIMQQMAFIKEWGGRFVIPAPKIQVV